TSLTGSLSDRTQTLPTGNVVKTYVDTTTIGTTADPNITEATFHVANPPSFHDGLDDTALHTSMHFPNPQASDLTLIRKFSDTTELAVYLTRTVRKVRIIAEGAVVGAATAKNTIQLDFYGAIASHTHTWLDGLLYASIMLQGVYDSTNTAAWKFVTINSVSAAYTAA
ncbi:MAG: hypothetical protein IT189_00345, partial [Microbacteriaceae bacterium]|nr:hypothetical protein [Microbacteriaceae bacterium]